MKKNQTLKLMLILLLASISAWSSTKVDMATYIRQHDLTWEQLPLQWNEGAFVGNGQVGMMIYADTTANALVFHLGRTDVTDHRKAPNKKTSIGVKGADKMVDFCRLDVGKMLLVPEGKITSGTFRLDIYNAELTGHIQTDKGELEIRAYTPYQGANNVVEVSSETHYHWKGIPGNPQSPRVRVFKDQREKLNYVDNPATIVNQQEQKGSWVQPLLAGGDYATYWEEVPNGKKRSILYVAIANEVPASGVSLPKAIQSVKEAQTAGSEKLRKQTQQWWHAYHERSYISIPDKKLENFYFIQMYKLGTCSRPNGPAIDLMGPFFKLSQWPSYWWNLNIQLTYMPVYPANRLEQGENFLHLMDEVFVPLIHALTPAKIGDYTWALQNYVQHLQYAGADWTEIKQRFLPKATEALGIYREILHQEDGTWHLYPIESPEYEGFKTYKDSNYGLASLRWLLGMMIQCHEKSGTTHPELENWKDLLAHVAPFQINENGMMIAADKPLDKSHRHYSHLLAFYPYHLLSPEDSRSLLEKSVNHWLGLENGASLTGYSYTGASSLYAYLGDGEKAYQYMEHFINKPIGISLLLPNTFYVECSGKSPVIETPLSAAAALAQMLIQSWGETIRPFPALPEAWKDCYFHELRAEGGFTVSASRKDGKTEWVTVTSEKGRPCRIQLPGWKNIYQVSGKRKVKIAPAGNDTYVLDLKAGETIGLAPAPRTNPSCKLTPAKPGEPANFYGVKQGKGLKKLMEWDE